MPGYVKWTDWLLYTRYDEIGMHGLQTQKSMHPMASVYGS
jgi:hypothetical protein